MSYPIPDAVLVHHAAFLGKTRSGKTSSAKTAVERFAAAGERVCILDPIKSDWWGMTSSPDGQSPGLPFRILGGPHGHVQLPSSSGKVIGELIASGELPLSIIDMAWFEAGGLQRFFCDFAETLMRHQRGVLHLVIEEAHEFAPKERAGIGDENMAIHWAKKLATAGGSKGIRLIVATQRTQALHNALLGSCETMVAHRLTAPADQKPVIDWLKANVEKGLAAEIAQSLAGLPTGTAWVCSGEAQLFERVMFPRIATFDNSATPMSDDEAAMVTTAPVDVEALRGLIGEAAKEAEANDPKALKAEIAKLRQQVEAGGGAAADWPDQRAEVSDLRGQLAAMEQRALTAEGLVSGYIVAGRNIEQVLQDAVDTAKMFHAIEFEADTHLKANGWTAPHQPAGGPESTGQEPGTTDTTERLRMSPTPAGRADTSEQASGRQVASAPRVPSGGSPAALDELPRMTRKLIQALIRFYPRSLPIEHVAKIGGVGIKSSAWNAHFRPFKGSGLVEQMSNQEWRISDDGAAALGLRQKPAAAADLLQFWVNSLPPSTGTMLRVLVEARDWLSKEEVARRANISPTSSGLGSGLKELRDHGLVVQRTGGDQRAAEVLL